MAQVIVVGGGLAGMSAAHTVLENGGRVLVLDKSAFCGGNSTKATSGINGAGTRSQRMLKIPDTPETFEHDTTVSAAKDARPNLIRALTHQSGSAVDWLMDAFGLDLSVVNRLAAHSHPRTHRGKERFPGMAITYGLMERLDEIAAQSPEKARVITKARVFELISENGEVVGVKYEKGGKTFEERGVVVLATGGFGADFSADSLLASVQEQWRTLPAWQPSSRSGQQNKGKNVTPPPLLSLPTTNGPHCTGDGIKLALGAGADTFDLHAVQVHPTGLVDPAEPDAKVKFLAAEALRGCGALILDRDGHRFSDELGKRDYVTGRMWWHNKPPYRLVLNSKCIDQISWHVEHYEGRGLMKSYKTGADLAKDMGIPASRLAETFAEYNRAAANPSGPDNKWDKKFFNSTPFEVNDHFAVAVITPVVHYCMGGVATNELAQIITKEAKPIAGLFGAGECLGGIHGENRLGGSSLLDCVVYGRIAGRSASKHLLEKLTKGGAGGAVGSGALRASVAVVPGTNKVNLEVSWGASGAAAGASEGAGAAEAGSSRDDSALEEDPNAAFYGQGVAKGGKKAAAAPAAPALPTLTMADVAGHKTEKDCWVVLHGLVYDVSAFLNDHPGGKKAIMLYAGKDATKEFDMLHKRDVIAKYLDPSWTKGVCKDAPSAASAKL